MLKNYLSITLRRLVRDRGYTVLNILGLTIGMACAILISLYIRDELSYDRHNRNADRIYRVVTDRSARTSAPLGPFIKSQIPEGEQVLRLRPTFGTWLFATEERRFYERRVYWADQSLFSMFDVALVRGDPATALAAPFTMVISNSMAQKYFEDKDPIGQVILGDNSIPFTITAIMEDPPDYAHYHPDFYVSIATMIAREESGESFQGITTNWLISQFYTYLLLPSGVSPDDVVQKLRSSLDVHLSDEIKGAIFSERLTLQPLTDIHLYSHLEHEMEPNGEVSFIWMLMAVGLFILLIACINFMNLATARSATRAREVGMRKVVGAQRRQLIGQFLGEAIMFSTTAFLLALGLIALVLPAFRALTGYTLSMPAPEPWPLAVGLGIVLAVGILAGSYPAFVLSGFAPAAIFKGKMGGGSSLLRKSLVVMQFTISIILIIGTTTVYQQLEYIRSKDLGFDRERVIVIPVIWGMDFDMIHNRYTQEPGVVSVADMNYLPGRPAGRGNLPIFPLRRMDQPEAQTLDVLKLGMWGNMVRTLGLEIIAGRNLDFVQDTRMVTGINSSYSAPIACLLNEEAVRKLGWATPREALDQTIIITEQEMRVIGVIKDFHLKSLHEKIEPMIISFGDDGIFGIRLAAGNPGETLAKLQKMWEESRPHIPFSFTFLDEDVDRLYRADQTLGRLITLFAFLTVLTACLGLSGLSALTTQQRTKEIGVRKVLGASVGQMLLLLSREYTLLVLISNLIAWPVAYGLMNRWLQSFAYHTDISLILFPAAALLTLIIAWLTVGIQTIKSATANPVDALRYE